jgi:hypothetical protein
VPGRFVSQANPKNFRMRCARLVRSAAKVGAEADARLASNSCRRCEAAAAS